jgi:uncharacterized tellurite resistance protein B-like protein
MSLLDLFTSGAHKKAKTYFAALVKLAFSDGALDALELKYLKKMALKLDIEDAEFTKILGNPDRYPIDSPLDYNERIEQLYYFTGIIFVSHDINSQEKNLIEKLAVGLGFPPINAKKVTEESIRLFHLKTNIDDYVQAIKAVNSF